MNILVRLQRVSPAAAALAVAVMTADPAPLAAQAGSEVCDIRTDQRVVAVGDVHGAYDELVAILREAGLIDRRDRWSGGQAIFVQTGDVLDRGTHSKRVLDLLRRLERDAERAGGRVLALLGNHEHMRLMGDWRDVSAGEYRAFERVDSPEVREAAYQRAAETTARRAAAEQRSFDARAFREEFLENVPLGFVEMRQAFSSAGEYGRWLRARRTMVVINGVAFVHGGISEETSLLGCEGVNAAMTTELATLSALPAEIESLLGTRPAGPLWYRGLATEPETTFAPTLATILERLRARAIVVGHTPVPGRITVRFGGQVVLIDAGMLSGAFYPKGAPSALELHGDRLTAIYLDRREDIATLPAFRERTGATSGPAPVDARSSAPGSLH